MQTSQGEEEESKGSGDPFKDFASEIEKVVSKEARDYISKGRESCYEFIDLLYRTDWKFYGKYQNVKVYQLAQPGMDLLFRCETKFANISVASLIEFYSRIDKRMAWEGSQLYSSIEEVKTYPMNTSVFYYKLQQQQWPTGFKELLLLLHGVQLRGNRHYLVATSIDHPEF